MGSETKAHPQRWDNFGNRRSAMDRAGKYLTLPYLTFPLARILLVVEPDANDASDLLVDGDGSEVYEDDEVKDSTISKRMCHMSLR